jgi:hypothetical protein
MNCASSIVSEAASPSAAKGLTKNASARVPATRRPGKRLMLAKTVFTDGEIRT